MLIAVSGATGFIGSNAIQAAIGRGWNCLGLVHLRWPELPTSDRLQLLRLTGSTDEQFHQLSNHQIDAVIHCATRYSYDASLRDVDEMLACNIQAGLSLLEYASASGAVFINLSTVFQHGPGLPYHPNSLYAATKQAFADLLKHYVSNRGLAAVDLCLHDTYGPGDRRRKLLPQLLDGLRNQREVKLGSLDTQMNLVYITDVTRAIVASIEAGVSGSFSVVADENHTIREVVEILEQISGLNLSIVIDHDLVRSSQFPRPVAPRLPDWRPTVDLQQGLSRILKEDQT